MDVGKTADPYWLGGLTTDHTAGRKMFFVQDPCRYFQTEAQNGPTQQAQKIRIRGPWNGVFTVASHPMQFHAALDDHQDLPEVAVANVFPVHVKAPEQSVLDETNINALFKKLQVPHVH